MNQDEWWVNTNAAVVCVLPGSRNQSLFFWLCCDMLNATFCASGGFRVQVSSIFFWKAVCGLRHGLASCSLPHLSFTCLLLWHYGHMRGTVQGCIASVSSRDLICWLVERSNTWDTGRGELGQYVPTPWAPTIAVSVNPLIMAFITSHKYRRVSHKAGACLSVSSIW